MVQVRLGQVIKYRLVAHYIDTRCVSGNQHERLALGLLSLRVCDAYQY